MTADRAKLEIIKKQAARVQKQMQEEEDRYIPVKGVLDFLELIEDIVTTGEGEPEAISIPVLFREDKPGVTLYKNSEAADDEID